MSPSGEEPISAAIVRAIADARGLEPSELEFRLQDCIDTDALEALSGHEGGEWAVEFRVAGHRVEVEDDGTVVVDGERYQ